MFSEGDKIILPDNPTFGSDVGKIAEIAVIGEDGVPDGVRLLVDETDYCLTLEDIEGAEIVEHSEFRQKLLEEFDRKFKPVDEEIPSYDLYLFGFRKPMEAFRSLCRQIRIIN